MEPGTEGGAVHTVFDTGRVALTPAAAELLVRLTAIHGRPPDLTTDAVGCPFSPRCRYVQPACRTHTPPLVEHPHDPGHLYACFYPAGSVEGQEIRRRVDSAPAREAV